MSGGAPSPSAAAAARARVIWAACALLFLAAAPVGGTPQPVPLQGPSLGSLHPAAAAAVADRAASTDRAPAAAAAAAPAGGALGYRHFQMAALVRPWGYPLEEHFVETADGYVLGVYRIPHGRREQAAPPAAPPARAAPRPPLLLWHGLLDSSAAWVLNRPEQSLGFLAADAGHDVWLPNSRGNAFSRNHTFLDPAASAAFWDFSFDEMAEYDLPAAVAYVLEATGTPRVAYVGHSQGATLALAALAGGAGARARAARAALSAAALLAPAAYAGYVSSPPLRLLAAMRGDELAAALGRREFLPGTAASAALFADVCRAAPLACVSAVAAICGYNAQNFNLSRLPTAVEYAPAGTSVRALAHWAQLVRAASSEGRPAFRRFDFGGDCGPAARPRRCNRREYGAAAPPEYDLGAAAAPPGGLAVFWGAQDALADAADVRALLAALPAGAVAAARGELGYAHLDFTWGVNAHVRVYPEVLRLVGGGGGAPAAAA